MFDKDNIAGIIDILDEGGVILMPTDTIWALGCDAYNEEAIEQIYAIKGRPKNKTLTILVDAVGMIKQHVQEIHPKLETLLAYHERPLTVIYENGKNLPSNLVAADGSVSIRLTTDPFCKRIIQELGRPLVASSANLINEPIPHHFGQISSDVISQAKYIVRHRQDDKTSGEPSVMIRLSKKAELIFVRN